MGKFYEMFEMDAHVGAQHLDLQYMRVCMMAYVTWIMNFDKHIQTKYFLNFSEHIIWLVMWNLSCRTLHCFYHLLFSRDKPHSFFFLYETLLLGGVFRIMIQKNSLFLCLYSFVGCSLSCYRACCLDEMHCSQCVCPKHPWTVWFQYYCVNWSGDCLVVAEKFEHANIMRIMKSFCLLCRVINLTVGFLRRILKKMQANWLDWYYTIDELPTVFYYHGFKLSNLTR